MRNSAFSLMIVALFWIFQACNNNTSTDSMEAAEDSIENSSAMELQENDSEFMFKAANGGMMDVEAGKIAQAKGQSQSVKDFGGRMVNDHTMAGGELKTLAASKNVALPSAPDKDVQEHLTEMGKLTGTAFDDHYKSMMVDDHDKTVKMFEDASKDAKDADVRAWAAKTLTTIKEHQQAAKAIKEKL